MVLIKLDCVQVEIMEVRDWDKGDIYIVNLIVTYDTSLSDSDTKLK